MSLEKEVFPFMAQDRQLFAFDLEGSYIICIIITPTVFTTRVLSQHRNVNGRGMYVRVITNTTVC